MYVINKQEERAFLIDCLAVYKSLPALWDSKSKSYRNKSNKDEAYEILVAKFREKFPNINRNAVTKKINTLRTNFRKEQKRLSQEGKTESNLWYFDQMKFLSEEIDMKVEYLDCDGDSVNIELVPPSPPVRDVVTHSDVTTENLSTANSYEEQLAKIWAMELRKMTPEQQIYAKKAINEILYEGQLGNLYKNCVHIYSA